MKRRHPHCQRHSLVHCGLDRAVGSQHHGPNPQGFSIEEKFRNSLYPQILRGAPIFVVNFAAVLERL
jgi:hypothetical protein